MTNKSKITSLSVNGLKLHKGKTILLILSILLTSSVLFFSTGYLDLDYKHTTDIETERYGSYEYVVVDVTSEQAEALENPFLEKNTIHIYGSNSNGNIGSIDHYDLIPLRLIEGRMPEKEDEIVIEQTIVDAYVGDTIELTYTSLQNEQKTNEYQVVGIVNNYSSEFVAYRNYWEDYGYSSVQRTDTYEGTSVQYIILEKNEVYESIVYYRGTQQSKYIAGNNVFGNTATVSMETASGEPTIYRENSLLRESIIFFLTIMITIVSYFGISQLNISQRSRFVLLRSLGATSFQLFTINMIQIGLVLLISVPIAFLISYIGIYIISKYIQYVFVVSIEHMIECCIVILIGVVFGLSLPMLTTITSSLTKRKKGIRRVKIKKVKMLNPMRLASRHNYLNLKSNIIFIFIMVIGIDVIAYNIDRIINPIEDDFYFQIRVEIQGDLSERNQKIIDQFDHPYVTELLSSETRRKEAEGEDYPIEYIITGEEYLYFENEQQRNAYIQGEICKVGYADYYKDLSTGEIFTKEEIEGYEDYYMYYYTPAILVGDTIDGLTVYDTTNIVGPTGYYVYLSEAAAHRIGLQIDSKRIVYSFNTADEYREITNTVYKIKADPAVVYVEDNNEYYMRIKQTTQQKNIQSTMIASIAGLILFIMIFQRYSTEVLSRKREISLYRAIGMEEQNVFKKVLLEIIELLVIVTLISLISMYVYIINKDAILVIYGIVLSVLLILCVSSYILPIKDDLSQPILKELKTRE